MVLVVVWVLMRAGPLVVQVGPVLLVALGGYPVVWVQPVPVVSGVQGVGGVGGEGGTRAQVVPRGASVVWQ